MLYLVYKNKSYKGIFLNNKREKELNKIFQFFQKINHEEFNNSEKILVNIYTIIFAHNNKFNLKELDSIIYIIRKYNFENLYPYNKNYIKKINNLLTEIECFKKTIMDENKIIIRNYYILIDMEINKIKILSLLSLLININSMEKNIDYYYISNIQNVEENIKDCNFYLKEIEKIQNFYKELNIAIKESNNLEEKKIFKLKIIIIFMKFSEIEKIFNIQTDLNNIFQKKITDLNFEKRTSNAKKIISNYLKYIIENKEKIIKNLTKKPIPKEIIKKEEIKELTPAQVKRRKKKELEKKEKLDRKTITNSEINNTEAQDEVLLPLYLPEADIAVNIFSKNKKYYSKEKSRSNSKYNKNKYNQLLRSNSLKSLKLIEKSELFKTDNNR